MTGKLLRRRRSQPKITENNKAVAAGDVNGDGKAAPKATVQKHVR